MVTVTSKNSQLPTFFNVSTYPVFTENQALRSSWRRSNSYGLGLGWQAQVHKGSLVGFAKAHLGEHIGSLAQMIPSLNYD